MSADSDRARVCSTGRLLVRVNDELVLDAGTCEEASGPTGFERRIRPPETALFRQVLSYLRAKPDPPGRRSRTTAAQEGVAAAALTLRWGSYLAVLLDRHKPLWPAADSQGISRIGDAEMARLNIEASAALAEWIELFRADPSGRSYMQIVDRALFYLPVSPRSVKLEFSEFGALAVPEIAAG